MYVLKMIVQSNIQQNSNRYIDIDSAYKNNIVEIINVKTLTIMIRVRLIIKYIPEKNV